MPSHGHQPTDEESTSTYLAGDDHTGMTGDSLVRVILNRQTEIQRIQNKTLAKVTAIDLRLARGDGRMDLMESRQGRTEEDVRVIHARCERRACVASSPTPAQLPPSEQEEAEISGKTVNVGAVVKLFAAFAAGVAVVIGALAALGTFK